MGNENKPLKLDKCSIPRNKLTSFLREMGKSSLIRNAWYILLSVNVVPSFIGFLFWIIASRLYEVKDVGVASAIISAISLVSLLASLGTNIGLMRFIPEVENPNRLINSILDLNIIISVILSAFFFFGLPLWAEKLKPDLNNPILVVIFSLTVILSTLSTTIRDSFIALKRSKYSFIFMSIFQVFRILIVLFGINYGLVGLVGSLTLSYMVSNIVGIFLLMPQATSGFRRLLVLSWSDIKPLIPFSGGNYLATISLNLASTIIPLITIEVLGAEANAYSYIVLMLGSFIASPGSAIALSAFAEGSNNFTRSMEILKKALTISVGITLSFSLIMITGAPWFLIVFGPGYAEQGSGLLRWLSLAAPFVVVNQFIMTELRLNKKNLQIILFSILQAFLILLSSYILLPLVGIVANGIGSFMGNIIASIIAGLFLLTRKPGQQNEKT